MKRVFLYAILAAVSIGIFIGILFYEKNVLNDKFKCENCNVLIVGFDAEQARHIHAIGYPKMTSPTQDELARNGFLFTNAISQSSWTVPAFMSYFTSLYPSEHKLTNKYIEFSEGKKIISNFGTLSPEKKTLAEVFRDNDYVTGGFTGDAGVGAQFGYNKGFDVYMDSPSPFAGFETSIPPALQWLSKNKNKKFFMFLHSYGIHGQYDPPEGYSMKFLDFQYKGSLKGGKEEQAKLREEGLANGKLNLTQEDYGFWQAIYDEKIYDSDKKIGEFLKEFDKLGLTKNTVIIFVSDHGTELGEHNRLDHGFTLYDELINVPIIIKFPSRISGTINSQVRAIDLMPTIIDALGLKIDDKVKNQMQGKSLIPLMRGEESSGRDAFSETDYRNYTHKKSLRTADGWKFIYTFENDQKELYNIKKDPGEKNNLIKKEPKISYELEQKLFEYIKKTGQDIIPLKSTGCFPVYGEICTEKLVK